MLKVFAAKKSLVAKKSFSTTTPVKTAPATVLDHDADDSLTLIVYIFVVLSNDNKNCRQSRTE